MVLRYMFRVFQLFFSTYLQEIIYFILFFAFPIQIKDIDLLYWDYCLCPESVFLMIGLFLLLLSGKVLHVSMK